MPLKLTGGSLTLSITAIAIAWTVRSLREQQRRRISPSVLLSSGKFFSELSLEAIALLVRFVECSCEDADDEAVTPATVLTHLC